MSLAPAATKDGFSYAGDLYAETSGHNRHRRAGVAELKEHFKSGSDKDHPAHWFEAQLIHYGLPPSKTKSVARMRLFDAVNSGKIAVPAHIKKMEANLKKEWTKNEREAMKAIKSAVQTSTTSSTATSKKRKADSSNVDMVISAGGINITVSANNASAGSSATKKAKTSTTATAAGNTAKNSPKPKPKPGTPKASTASKAKPATPAASSKKAATTAPSSSAKSPASTAKKQTARRGGISQGPNRASASTAQATSSRPPRTKQTARRSGAFFARGRVPTTDGYDSDNDFDEPPPPYEEFDDDHHDDYDEYDDPDDGSDRLRPLGLLNGRYDMISKEVTGQWGYDDLDLVFTISGREMWGKFELGVISGIMHFNERPFQSSHDEVPFTWRGEEREGQIWYGNTHRGWIKFLGDGLIEGELDYMSLDFRGQRVYGQGTRSEVDAQSMRQEWNGYSEEEYERLNRARWR
ncbi:hypothetical protein F4777DRAFT_516820 [Nemania sp. FL0916]|nr:hypothetical protein F4777DRAFT_516820 [Nemania sp. FL0916]